MRLRTSVGQACGSSGILLLGKCSECRAHDHSATALRNTPKPVDPQNPGLLRNSQLAQHMPRRCGARFWVAMDHKFRFMAAIPSTAVALLHSSETSVRAKSCRKRVAPTRSLPWPLCRDRRHVCSALPSRRYVCFNQQRTNAGNHRRSLITRNRRAKSES